MLSALKRGLPLTEVMDTEQVEKVNAACTCIWHMAGWNEAGMPCSVQELFDSNSLGKWQAKGSAEVDEHTLAHTRSC
ncbi:MAG: hypothetical protein AAGF78_08115 [Pseudomonadota bacterium]